MAMQILRNHIMRDPVDKVENTGTTIRPASTANFLIDSTDRRQSNINAISTDFIINKNQSLFNGFFTRFGLTEIVLDWCIDNVSDQYDPPNNVFSVTTAAGPTTYTVTLDNGKYNVAEILDTLVVLLNAASAPGTFRLEDQFGAAYVAGTSYGPVYLATTGGGNFTINNTSLAEQLNLLIGTPQDAFPVDCPKVLPITYLDFVSPQLTYNQDLKDNTSSIVTRDSIYRWVLAWDGPAPADKYGFPIFQGYKPFVSRRYIAYPKQIRWDTTQPLGQVAFQVYTSYGELFSDVDNFGELEFYMTFLVTEN